MGRALSVLIVEDSEDDELLLLMCLRQAGFEPIYERVQTASAMAAALDRTTWELVISDHNMPSFSAPEALALLHAKGHDLPFIIVSGSIGEEAAVIAMKAGAQDYLVKGQLGRLPAAIERELKDAEERRARKTAEHKVRFLAYFDPLTSLPNRTNLCEQLRQLLTDPARDGAALAVLSLKFENLREVNNTLGYGIGERVLVELGSRLHQAVEAPQLLARIGGAEFAVLLPAGDIDSAMSAAHSLQQAVAGPIAIDALEVDATTTIGIALYPGHGDDPEVLLQRTNAALAQAAETSSRIAIYDRDGDPFQPRRLSMIS